MFNDNRFRLLYLLLLLTAVVLPGLFLGPLSHAQSARSLEAKADADLKQVYQLYRQQAGAGLNAAHQGERDLLKSRIAVEEQAGAATVGVLMLLREDSPQALDAAEAEIEARGFHVRARIGNVAVATVLVDDLPRLAEIDSVRAIGAARYRHQDAAWSETVALDKRAALRAMNDAANAAVKAPDARSAYNVTGRGVIFGSIDSGVDWRHGDFRRADGSTRFKFFWDLSDPARTGPGGVGRVYTEAQINAALQQGSGVNARDTSGHGTHVAGTAAGNGLGTAGGTAPGTFAGIAPEADLVAVKATRNGSDYRDDDLLAAMLFIRDRAVELNEPFVINMSIGGQEGQRDGTEVMEVAIDNLLKEGAGRQFVTSAGNTGSVTNHAGGVIAQGSEVTLPFIVSSSDPDNGLQVIYGGGDTINLRLIKPNAAVLGPVVFGASLNSDSDVTISHSTSPTNNGARNALVKIKNPLSGIWKLVLTGERISNGRYDVWSTDRGLTQFDPAIADGIYEIGWPKGIQRGLVVANFITKTQWVDVNGNMTVRSGPLGAAHFSSSAGPTRDGRLKPDLAAPGTRLMSALSADATRPADSSIAPGGKYQALLGTSMSSPMVAGTIALMLQANRNLTPDQIRRLLLRTVINDNFTGPAVSYKYGYGKLNAFAAVKAVVEGVASSEFVSVSAASFAPDLIAAPDSILAGFGANLAPGTEAATSLPLPTSLAGTSVRIADSAGNVRLAPLFFVSPGQVNYNLPPGTALGVAQIEVLRNGNVVARGAVSVNTVWPGLFYVDSGGRRVGAANVLRVKSNGRQLYESPFDPIDLSVPGDTVLLVLYGTSLRGRSDLSKVKVTLGGTPLAVNFAGPQGDLVGLDQINAVIPNNLAGRGAVDLLMYVDEWPANTLQFTIK